MESVTDTIITRRGKERYKDKKTSCGEMGTIIGTVER